MLYELQMIDAAKERYENLLAEAEQNRRFHGISANSEQDAAGLRRSLTALGNFLIAVGTLLKDTPQSTPCDDAPNEGMTRSHVAR